MSEEKLTEIQGKLSNDYYFPAVHKDIEFLLSELENARRELDSLKAEKRLRELFGAGSNKLHDDIYKLIKVLVNIKKLCENSPAYRTEAYIYKMIQDTLSEIGVTS